MLWYQTNLPRGHNTSKEATLFRKVFSSPGPKVQVNYCHHLASVVCRLSSVVCRLSSVVCRLSSVNFSHFKLLLRNHWSIGTKLSRNVPWMVLYKITVFRSSRIFNMTARANNMLWLAEISKIFFSETNELTETKLKRMIIGMSFTKLLFFMPIGNPRWPPSQDID